MSRFQLSLNVADVDAAVEFYTHLLGVEPAKHREGYANFVVADPPMKLIVIENEGEPGSINHLGIEHADGNAVATEAARVAELGLPVLVDEPHTCCFATQEKAWTRDPSGLPWEIYTVTENTEGFGANPHGGEALDAIVPPIGLAELQAAIADPEVVVIDAQGPGGYETAHIDGAINFELETVAEQAASAIDDPDQRVVLYCTDESCLGAEFVGTVLAQQGYTNVVRYPDGVDGWRNAGLEVQQGERTGG